MINHLFNILKKKPAFSIIIRTVDRPGLIRNAIRSAGNQTVAADCEIIIVADGKKATFNSEWLSLAGSAKLEFIRTGSRSGRVAAARAGIMAATGESISFLDDDDEFLPNHLELLGSLRSSKSKVAYSGVEMTRTQYNENWDIMNRETINIFNQPFNYGELHLANYIPFNALLFERKLIKKLDFDESFDLYEDWDLLLRAARETGPFAHIDHIGAIYNQWGSDQIAFTENRENIKKSTLQLYKKHMKHFPPEMLLQMRTTIKGH